MFLINAISGLLVTWCQPEILRAAQDDKLIQKDCHREVRRISVKKPTDNQLIILIEYFSHLEHQPSSKIINQLYTWMIIIDKIACIALLPSFNQSSVVDKAL